MVMVRLMIVVDDIDDADDFAMALIIGTTMNTSLLNTGWLKAKGAIELLLPSTQHGRLFRCVDSMGLGFRIYRV